MIPPQTSSRRTVFAPHFASSGFIGLNRITTVALNTHGFLSSPRIAPSPHIHPLCSIRTGTLFIPTILFPCSSDAGAICPWVLSELAVVRFSSFFSVILSHPRSDRVAGGSHALLRDSLSFSWLAFHLPHLSSPWPYRFKLIKRGSTQNHHEELYPSILKSPVQCFFYGAWSQPLFSFFIVMN
jgi:hypothetical protein